MTQKLLMRGSIANHEITSGGRHKETQNEI
jgi:hypothetical protein